LNKRIWTQRYLFIVFSSPAGSTRHIAAVIEKELKRLRADVESLDLKNQKELSTFQNLISSAEKNACLFIGRQFIEAWQ